MTTSQTKTDLLAAAEVIRTEGWITGEYKNLNGMCLEGGIREVVSQKYAFGQWPSARITAASDALAEVLPDCDGSCREVFLGKIEADLISAGTLPSQMEEEMAPYRAIFADGRYVPMDPSKKVYHHNDYHCSGGEEAALWLDKAAANLPEGK